MHHRKRFWPFVLGALVLIAVVALIGRANTQAAWSQGYMMGRLSAGAEGEALLPYMLGYGQPGGHSVLPWVVGGILVILGVAVIGKFLRFGAWHHWRKAGGPEHREEWAKRWSQHGPPFPWAWHGPPAGPAEGAEPEAQAEEETAS